ncbi:MAG: DNA alkylation repair protein [Bdellovibrionia bacterium]
MKSRFQQLLRERLKNAADPKKAPGMQAYMKSIMPYYGVQSPYFKALCREIWPELIYRSKAEWTRDVRLVWDQAKFREERYGALALCAHKMSLPFQDVEAMKLYEYLIVSGQWWDFVDDIASHRVGYILESEPTAMKKMMLKWSRDENMWKRRTSIICQLGFKADTDLKLLYACIEPSLGSKEFFLQKAIGWALRQYAWTDAKEIKKFVKKNQERLAPLSRREALKNV